MQNDVYLVYAKRSAIGSFGGSLASLRVDDMLAQLFSDLKASFDFSLAEIDDVIIGCANQAGEDNRNLARMSLLLAGFPYEVPATTINRLCGSSLDAVIGAYARIKAGLGECFIAGGAESMSRAPYVMSKAEAPYARDQKIWDTAIGWRFPNPKMAEIFPLLGMGETAEEVQKLYHISRQEQDLFAFDSHQKAITAIKNKLFDNEIVPLQVQKRKETLTFAVDEGPRADTNLEKLAKLRSAFIKDGTVTAGNSSSINDGASLVLIASGEFIKKHNLTPLARITGGTTVGLHPNTMGLGPIGATQKLAKMLKIKPTDFDLVELNEAFAVQALACIKELKLNPEMVNRLGGGISLGHPLGASGTRILTTLVHQMQKEKKIKTGLATMCIGVGQGIAVGLENCV